MKQTISLLLFFLCFAMAFSQTKVNIWEGTDTKKNVELIPFVVEGKNNRAIIVCPGGSYFWHDTHTEGTDVAKWLNNNGISAFVLKYRVAGVPAFITHFRYLFRGNQYPDAQNDLLQSIRYIRKNSSEYGIDPNKIGAMGFSAGGHLVMSAAELFPENEIPFFVAPIYPVVSLIDSCTHKRSRRALLGDKNQNNKIMQDSLSLERHVPSKCPPVFLVNCIDDPIVDYRNSVLLDSALTANGVPHVYLQYKTGGHGFGASESKGSEECRAWRKQFINWINVIMP